MATTEQLGGPEAAGRGLGEMWIALGRKICVSLEDEINVDRLRLVR